MMGQESLWLWWGRALGCGHQRGTWATFHGHPWWWLPACVAEKGDFLAVDLGGSQFRAHQVKVFDDGKQSSQLESKFYPTPKEVTQGSGAEVGPCCGAAVLECLPAGHGPTLCPLFLCSSLITLLTVCQTSWRPKTWSIRSYLLALRFLFPANRPNWKR